MKKTVIWSVVAVAVVGATAVVALWKDPPDHRPIVDAVRAANYCTESADCPFSTELVNARELAKVNGLYKGYFDAGGSRCMTSEFDNRDFSRITCELGKCVAATRGK